MEFIPNDLVVVDTVGAKRSSCPYKNLLIAIVKLAIDDLFCSLPGAAKIHQRSAYRWIFSDEHDLVVLKNSFQNICALLDIDCHRARRALKNKLIENHVDIRLLARGA